MSERPGRGAFRSVAPRAVLLTMLITIFTLVMAGAPALGVDVAADSARGHLSRGTALSTDRSAIGPAPLALRLKALTPTVATPGAPIAVSLTVTNSTDTAVSDLRVEARLGPASALLTRSSVHARAAGTASRTSDPVVASNTLATLLAPKESRVVELTLPGEAIRPQRAYGTLPLTFTAGAGSAATTMSTFLPFQRVKEYEPLSLAFAAPLTLDPDPALISGSREAQAGAWAKQLAPGGRLDRIVQATSSAPVTWAVDPSIVGDTDTDSDTETAATPTATPTPTPTAGATESPISAARKKWAQTLRDGGADHPLWALPAGDPDLEALTRLGASLAELTTIVAAPPALADTVGVTGSRAPARVAWPVGNALASADIDTIRGAYGSAGPAAVLTPSSALDASPDSTGPVARRTRSGAPLLTYDTELSALFASARDGAAAPELTQRFLAETMAVLAESPGRPRTLLVAAPRNFDPDVAATRQLFSGIAAAPWLQSTSTAALLDQLRAPSVQSAALLPTKDSLGQGDSPISAAGMRAVLASSRTVTGLAGVLSSATTASALPTAATLQGLLSTRWRSAPTAWTPLVEEVHKRLDKLVTGVTVQPSTINFFAEHGVVQVTVVNNLDVEVHDVRLVLDPQGIPPRLRVTKAADALTIRPRSRITVRVGVDAVAAGVVPVVTHLSTPSGTRLGTDATVRIRVQPTNGWLVLAVGGLVGVVFLAGLYRALRAGTPRVSSADLKDIDLQ